VRFLSVKPALAFAKFGGNFPIDFSDDELGFDQKANNISLPLRVLILSHKQTLSFVFANTNNFNCYLKLNFASPAISP